MKKSKLVMSAVLLVLFGLLVIFAQTPTNSASTMFEYKFEYNIKEKKANELGMEGWELAGITQDSNVTIYVFKRKK